MEVNFYYLFCVFAVTLGSMILHEIMHGVVALVLLVKASGFLLKILIYPHLVEANKK